MKRVYTLYRVSTAKQVDVAKDDIPMQRIACHEFTDRQQDWEILREFEEKGVSGFKVSAEKRDAIQDLKEAALAREFDVLLVFMFDRLGRIENETPFVLQWFAEHDKEGFRTHGGAQFQSNHILRILKNPIYCGYLKTGKPHLPGCTVKDRMKKSVKRKIESNSMIA